MNEKTNNQRFIGQQGEYDFSYNGKKGKEALELARKEIENEKLKAYNKYSPLGTIVSLSDSRKVMIIGYKSINNGVEYDYIGCEFPYGLDQNHQLISFNHNDITKFFNIGFINEQGNYYRDKLDQQMPKNDGLTL